MTRDFREFDAFFERGGYNEGDEPQAFADWLAGKTGNRVVGLSRDGAVQGDPPTSCVECEQRGCPTEGATFVCVDCGAVVCFGHVEAHPQRTGCARRLDIRG